MNLTLLIYNFKPSRKESHYSVTKRFNLNTYRFIKKVKDGDNVFESEMNPFHSFITI